MKKMRFMFFLVAISVVLGGCHQSATKKTSVSSSTSTQRTRKPATSSSQVKTKPSESTQAKTKMDLQAIQQGDFSSLTNGSWTQIATSTNFYNQTKHGFTVGGEGKLTVNDHQLSAGGITITGKKLTDQAGEHTLTYQTDQGYLSTTLADAANVAINWAVTFYPIGTTNAYTSITGGTTNRHNIIQVWTSNNSYTQVFAQNVTPVEWKSYQGLDLKQLAAGNYASLVGTWKNPTSGKTLNITDQVAQKPDDLQSAVTKAAVITGQDRDGYPMVISPGEMKTGGYMQGAIGYFDPRIVGPTFSPIAIVPKGVQLPALLDEQDDSDMNKDRLIDGGGQAGYASQAYYKVD